jgi:hypothetical protein
MRLSDQGSYIRLDPHNSLSNPLEVDVSMLSLRSMIDSSWERYNHKNPQRILQTGIFSDLVGG